MGKVWGYCNLMVPISAAIDFHALSLILKRHFRAIILLRAYQLILFLLSGIFLRILIL